MNLEYFIAKRLIATKKHKSTISFSIIKIAIVAIALGTVVMIISVATGIGLQEKIREKVAAFNGHIIISNFDNNQSLGSSEPISTHQNFYPQFKSVSGISHIQAVATKPGIIRTANSFEGIVLKGVGNDYDFKTIKEYLVKGKLPDVSHVLNDQILISETIANRLMLKIGSKCNTFFLKEDGGKPNLRVFKVVGIYNSGFQDFDATTIIGDIRHIQKINKWTPAQVGAFEVFIDDFNSLVTKTQEVYKEVPSNLNVTSIESKFYSIFEWLKLFDFNIIILLVVMISVATINMVVALLVLILERTQMIGILKSMGAPNWSIRRIFLYNASFLILRGLFWGNLIAITLLALQKYLGLVKLNPTDYYVNQAPVTINIAYILVLNLGTLLVCFLILIVPSIVISRIAPAKAIKFQ